MLDRVRWLHPRMILRDLLSLDDTPHAIAMGATIGVWLGMTPTVGVQMLIVIAIAACTSRFFYFSRTAALLTVYITNPLTLVPIYWFNYCVGAAILGESLGDRGDLEAALEYESLSGWWATVVSLAREFGWPLLVGSLVVATICAVVTYPAMHWLVRWFRGKELDDDRANGVTVETTTTSEPASERTIESAEEQQAVVDPADSPSAA